MHLLPAEMSGPLNDEWTDTDADVKSPERTNR